MSIVVFWLENGTARCETFSSTGLGDALSHCEALRRSAAAGASISHVCVSSELPDNMTKPGVADPAADYAWSKRRRPTRSR